MVDPLLSETRDLKAAQRFFRGARAVVGYAPGRVTTDGHDAYARAIRRTLGQRIIHRRNWYLKYRLKQDQRGINQRYDPLREFGSFEAAAPFCTAHDELRDYFRSRWTMEEVVSLAEQRQLFLDRWIALMGLIAA